MPRGAIVLFKKKMPVKLFNDWHKAGSWADNNVKKDFTLYSFDRVTRFKTIAYKLWLSFCKIYQLIS